MLSYAVFGIILIARINPLGTITGLSSVWCGVVWCGVVLCCVVWCCVVWCGVVSTLFKVANRQPFGCHGFPERVSFLSLAPFQGPLMQQ